MSLHSPVGTNPVLAGGAPGQGVQLLLGSGCHCKAAVPGVHWQQGTGGVLLQQGTQVSQWKGQLG